MNKLTLIAQESGLEESKTELLLKSFTSYFDRAKEIAQEAKSIEVTDEKQTQKMAIARGRRLELKSIRVEAEKTRKELKEQSLREGKAIDGIANVIKALIVPVEEYLEKQEKYAEILEAARKERQLNDRTEKLQKYVEDASMFNLADISDEVFSTLLSTHKKAYEDKIQAEKRAEEDRIKREAEERKEQERIRKENKQLKKDAAIREAKIKKERLAQQKQMEVERKKREAVEARIQAEKEKQEHEARIQREKEEAEKLAREEEQRKKLLAPDKEKLLELANSIELISMPHVSSREAGMVISKVIEDLERVVKAIREKSKLL